MIEALRTSILEPHDHLHIKHERALRGSRMRAGNRVWPGHVGVAVMENDVMLERRSLGLRGSEAFQ